MKPLQASVCNYRIFKIPLFKGTTGNVYYKSQVYLSNLSFSKIANLAKLLFSYLFKQSKVSGYPAVIKIDLTPKCQLQCEVCIHAPTFEPAQYFKNDMEMSSDLFKKICDEVSGKTLAFSLHYFGEPMLHKDISQMISYATQKNINTYFVTNFSMQLSDQELLRLVESGLHTIIVSLDGFSQATYSITRKNGDVELVKSNLRRFSLIRSSSRNKKKPIIAIQSLVFDHNLHEKYQIEKFAQDIAVDVLYFPKGHRVAWAVGCAPKHTPRAKKFLPLCPWPYFFSAVIYDGDVIPCCFYRQESIYAKNTPRLETGNLFRQSFKEVFNSSDYQCLRKLCAQPTAKTQDKAIYCSNCHQLYE